MWGCPTQTMPSKSYFASTRRTDFRKEQGVTAEIKKTSCIRTRFHNLHIVRSNCCDAPTDGKRGTGPFVCVDVQMVQKSLQKSIGRSRNHSGNQAEAPKIVLEIIRKLQKSIGRPEIARTILKPHQTSINHTKLPNLDPK